ncbi:dTMP kinase [Qipengyuania spongiae]|uniref:Thymidylate kinase n=1 Tax=Qipengyuania spongiae TaxID=2909673 RepID=A0ABY5SWE8_9SPHN|nr:dTMP kinase [Qipengyuania spongiae]UVI38880.1 dTMP kinase [Qipengyuania spongiae]
MTKGRFISFEGGEGAGKSTQARLLADHLRGLGMRVVLTREPGGTSGAEAIRTLLLHPPEEDWGARAEALLFAAARSDHVERLIRPALARGEWVICDRFIDSSRAYQGIAGNLGDAMICKLHDLGSEGLRPDRTIVLSASESEVFKRLERRDQGVADAIGGRDAGYHAKVDLAFRRFAEEEPNRFAMVESDGPVEAIHRKVLELLRPILERAQ